MPEATANATSAEDTLMETQQQALEEVEGDALFQKLSEKLIRVIQIEFRGLEKTEPQVVYREAQILREATNFQELQVKCEELYGILAKLDIFKAQQISIEEPSLEIPGTCDVIIRVHEKSVPYGSGGVHFNPSAQGGDVSIDAGLQNVFGHAEQVQLDASYKNGLDLTSSVYDFSLRLLKPRVKGTVVDGELQVSSTVLDRSKLSSYVAKATGISGRMLWEGQEDSTRYELRYDLARQQLQPPSGRIDPGFLAALGWNVTAFERGEKRQRPSHAVSLQMGDYLKSTASFTVEKVLTSSANPETLCRIRSINEISGLWPGAKVVRSLKQDMTLEGVWTPSLGSPFSIASAIRTGLLQPWGQGNKATFLPDRFSAGGVADNLRGFRDNSIGEFAPRPAAEATNGQARHDYLGGDFLAIANISGRMQLVARGTYAHIFGAVGTNVLLRHDKPLRELAGNLAARDLRSIARDLHYSYGAGAVIPFQRTIKFEFGVTNTDRPASSLWDHIYFGFNFSL